MSGSRLIVFVPGRPIPQGSKRAMLVRGKTGTRWTTLWLGTIDPDQLVMRMSGPESARVAHSVEAPETTAVGHNAEGRVH